MLVFTKELLMLIAMEAIKKEAQEKAIKQALANIDEVIPQLKIPLSDIGDKDVFSSFINPDKKET